MAILSEELEGKEFWYENILIPPVGATSVSPDEVDLSTLVSRNILTKIPIVSSPMDTVTEADMAIKLALLGGIGVLHFNYGSPSDSIKKRIKMQVADARKVKRFENGFILDPLVFSPKRRGRDLIALENKTRISRVPITEDGTMESRLVGVVSSSDVYFKKGQNKRLEELMTPLGELITAPASETLYNPDRAKGLSIANDYIEQRRLNLLPIVDNGRLAAIVTLSDIKRNLDYPYATKDENKRLKVLAAVETRPKIAFQRMEALAEVGVDGFVFDTAVFNVWGEKIVRQLEKKYQDQDFIVGNFASGKAVERVLDNEGFGKLIDAVKIGVGPGGACSTQDTTGVGRAQGSAVYDCAQAVKSLEDKYGRIGVIADGGVGESGHITLALALGADSVMLGRMLAGYDESPAKIDENRRKIYMGMASREAMQRGGYSRYSLDKVSVRAPEGTKIFVDYLGSIEEKERGLPVILAGVKQGLSKLNCKTIADLHESEDIEIVYVPMRK